MASPRPLPYFPPPSPPTPPPPAPPPPPKHIFDISTWIFPPASFPSAHSAGKIYYDIRSASGVEQLPASGCFALLQLWLISRPIRTTQPFPFQHPRPQFLQAYTGNVKQMHLDICLGFYHYFLTKEAIRNKKNRKKFPKRRKTKK